MDDLRIVPPDSSQNVKGVNSVKIDFEAKTATVVFDPDVTTPDAIPASLSRQRDRELNS